MKEKNQSIFFFRSHPCELPNHKGLVFYVHFVGVNPLLVITIIHVLKVICVQVPAYLQMPDSDEIEDDTAISTDQDDPEDKANGQVGHNQSESLETSPNLSQFQQDYGSVESSHENSDSFDSGSSNPQSHINIKKIHVKPLVRKSSKVDLVKSKSLAQLRQHPIFQTIREE